MSWCYKCNKQDVFDLVLIKTEKHEYYFCEKCLEAAASILRRIKHKTIEEETLYKQLSKYEKLPN